MSPTLRTLLALLALVLGACTTTPELVLELGAPELATTEAWVAVTADGARHDVTVIDRETRADGTWHVLDVDPAWCEATGYLAPADAPSALRFPLTPATCGAFAPDVPESGKGVSWSGSRTSSTDQCVCYYGHVWCRNCSSCGWYSTSTAC